MWTISDQLVHNNNSNFKCLQFDNYYFYTDKNFLVDDTNSLTWLYTGYVLPRRNCENKFKSLNGYALLMSLYTQYKEDFINYVQGNFVILKLQNKNVRIFSDRFGIKKFFYKATEKSFIITDDLNIISNKYTLTPSCESMGIYTVTYHFTGGTTIYNDVYHNQPGEIISFIDSGFTKSHYWKPDNLLSLPKGIKQIDDIVEALSYAVDNNLSLIDENRISLSLTGGADTRNLLAVFLSKNIRPHLYTYGNPLSADCKKASAICKGLNLRHEVHDIQMDSGTFEIYARRVIRQGGGLASIHRVHRLIAIEREKAYADSMFLGTLGGEYVKGVSEDDYIVPPVVYDNWDTQNYSPDLLKGYFIRKRLNYSDSLAEKIVDYISKEPYMKGDKILRKHNSLNYITAHLHDAQDVNLYNDVLDFVFTPFLDIDYMETLFSSQFTFDQKEVVHHKIKRRIENPVYAAQFLQKTYPPLTRFRYSGEHIPSEVLINKYYAGFMKTVRKKVAPKYPANLPLAQWMEDFVKVNLPLCKDYKILRETFDIDGMLEDLKSEKPIPKESYWLKYTNPIMMRFIMEEFNS